MYFEFGGQIFTRHSFFGYDNIGQPNISLPKMGSACEFGIAGSGAS